MFVSSTTTDISRRRMARLLGTQDVRRYSYALKNVSGLEG